MDNFARDFGPSFDCANWFRSSHIPPGPSTPKRFMGFSDFSGAPSASLTIHWDSPPPPIATVGRAPAPENPNSDSLHCQQQSECELEMAYFHADPTPFIPRGLNRLDVQARKPMERVVLL